MLDRALESVDFALAVKPDYAGAHYVRGNIFNKLPDQNASTERLALDAYAMAVDTSEEDTEFKPDVLGVALNNIGSILLRRRDDPEAMRGARRAFVRSLQVSPGRFSAHANLAEVMSVQVSGTLSLFFAGIILAPTRSLSPSPRTHRRASLRGRSTTTSKRLRWTARRQSCGTIWGSPNTAGRRPRLETKTPGPKPCVQRCSATSARWRWSRTLLRPGKMSPKCTTTRKMCVCGGLPSSPHRNPFAPVVIGNRRAGATRVRVLCSSVALRFPDPPQYTGAAEAYSGCTLAEADHASCWHGLGKALLRFGRAQDALDAFNAAGRASQPMAPGEELRFRANRDAALQLVRGAEKTGADANAMAGKVQ